MSNPAELKKLLFDNMLNQDMVAQHLGVSAIYVSKFINNKHIPAADYQIISDYFNKLNWPTDERIDNISRNGNEGLHYE